MSESHNPLAPSGDDPLVGRVIQERYRIEKRLGQGGMGAVYLAEHVLIQKKVAIKCLHAGLASNADVVKRFHNEALAATAIGHPNIVDVTDMGRFDDGTFFMALEYLPGRDWQVDLDRSGPQPLEKVAHIGMQICDALDAAARKGIVHRDLKPENIFLIERHDDPNFVKVLDFGISKFRAGIGGDTKTGELMGTPYYMAPEQVRGDRDINHVADIYSLGVILFQALAGEVPFDGRTLPELILKIAQQPAPSLASVIPTIPVPISDLVHRMLAKNAEERPQDFTEVAEVLSRFVSSSSRLSRSPRNDPHGETAIGGSFNELGSGEPVPDRPHQPTPVPARGPDTSAGGTPGMFGQTEFHDETVRSANQRRESDTMVEARDPASPTQGETQRSKSGLIVLAAVLVVGAASGVGAWLSSRSPAPSPTTEGTPTPAESPRNTVRVQISTLPPDAELFLDGEPISNPFDGQLERSKSSHELVAEREGFKDTKRTMVLSAEQRIFIPLEARTNKKTEDTDQEPTTSKKVPPPSAKKQPLQVAKPVDTGAPIPSPAPPSTPKPAPPSQPSPAAPQDLKKIFN